MLYLDDNAVLNGASWQSLLDALEAGHRLPRARIADQFLNCRDDTLLSRSAWIEGLGFGVKSVSVMPGNASANLPSVQGAMLVFEDRHGALEAIVDSSLLTRWKTAADSALGARLLARPEPEHYLIVGAGVVAETLAEAFSAVFPSLSRISIHNRTRVNAERLVSRLKSQGIDAEVCDDLEGACASADILSTATLSKAPVIFGNWIRPGTHVDLIGAFKADMREADDTLLQKARLYVDCRDTTLKHIGELTIPIASGAIAPTSVLGDLYDLVQAPQNADGKPTVTVFKNGGGAHLDLMTAKGLLSMHTNQD
jgi:ornithine cyclodeaminase/alanine dehydrogenase-like protein (mu-crystallin family)